MSPGATFERVYHELKLRLANGLLRPGDPIEPAVIGAEIAASVTPVRDALHRLVGERLVEAPNHNGFRVPQPTEAELRDLYAWNGKLLVLALRQRPSLPLAPRQPIVVESGDIAGATARLFLQIAHSTGSAEQVRAIEQLNDRLAPFRSVEARIMEGGTHELHGLEASMAGDRAAIARVIATYHRRRALAVPAILAAMADRE